MIMRHSLSIQYITTCTVKFQNIFIYTCNYTSSPRCLSFGCILHDTFHGNKVTNEWKNTFANNNNNKPSLSNIYLSVYPLSIYKHSVKYNQSWFSKTNNTWSMMNACSNRLNRLLDLQTYRKFWILTIWRGKIINQIIMIVYIWRWNFEITCMYNNLKKKTLTNW